MTSTTHLTVWAGALVALLACMANVEAAGRQDCEAFIDADLANIEGTTPVQVKSATYVPAAGELPAYCHLETYLNPHIGMDVFLPDDWNGKFLKRGCGGSCGRMYFNAWMPMCKTTLARGYACSLDDMGHQSTSYDFKWAYNNLQAKLDFALRSTHLTTIAAKAIIERFYGKPIRHSYFIGASSGGRQGLSLVQQFPLHFDGVMVGAPDGLDLHLHPLWSVLANLDENGRSILEPKDIPILHGAVLAKCDALDGVSDGVIADPRECEFDVSSLLCAADNTDGCLTKEQVEAARKIYRGPVDSQRRSLGFGPALGSEPNWVRTFISLENGKPSVYNKYFGDSFRYLRFPTDPGPAWQPRDFDWDRDPQRLYLFRAMGGVHNPDLRAFRERGGQDDHVARSYRSVRSSMGLDGLLRDGRADDGRQEGDAGLRPTVRAAWGQSCLPRRRRRLRGLARVHGRMGRARASTGCRDWSALEAATRGVRHDSSARISIRRNRIHSCVLPVSAAGALRREG